MRIFKFSAAIALAILSITNAQAGGFYDAPFHNVEVDAYSKIYVNYQFDPHKQTLVCSTDKAGSSAITSVEWEYKDATRKIGLPVTLRDDTKFKGYTADPQGKLIITNEFGTGYEQKGTIFVSCEYRNMQ